MTDITISGTDSPKSQDTAPTFLETNNVSNLNSSTQLTVEKIKNQDNQVRLYDKHDNGLELWSYTNCKDDSSNIIKQIRGIIVKDDKIILKTMPFTRKYTDNQKDNIKENIPDITKCKIYECHEGALIRLFYFENNWHLCTHKKLNAYHSKWASKESFGEIFEKSLENNLRKTKETFDYINNKKGNTIKDKFFSTLDKNNIYLFLVKNTIENRIVCAPPPQPTLYHVGTYINGNLDTEHNIKLQKQKRLNITSYDELIQSVKDTNPKYLQGVIVYLENNEQIKIINSDYDLYQKTRGNEQSIKFRYLQLRMDYEKSKILYYLYPDDRKFFKEYENIIYDIARMLYRAYVQRYIKKNYIAVPKQEFQVMKECHGWHVQDRQNNKITLDKIINVLNEQSPSNLNQMIRRYKSEKAKQKQSNTIKTPKSSILTPKSYLRDREFKISPMMLPSKIEINNIPPEKI